MAIGIQQSTMSAQEYWDDLLRMHPRWHAFFSLVGAALAFFIQGHFVIVIGRWAVMTGGRIAETAMLLSVLWITAARVAPEFTIYMPFQGQLTSACIIALSLLPEIILFHAIIICYDHWREALRKDYQVQKFHLVFAILYTIPTGLFIGMTVWTLILTANTGTVIPANGLLLSARYLAGWFYSLVEMIYPLIARRYNMAVTRPALLIDEKPSEENEQLVMLIKDLQQQVSQLQNAQLVMHESDTPPADSVTDFLNSEEIPELTVSPKITQPLSYQEVDTGEIEKVNKKVSTSRPRNASTKSAKVINLLKRNPNLKNAEVAKRVNVSAAYVSQIRSQMSM